MPLRWVGPRRLGPVIEALDEAIALAPEWQTSSTTLPRALHRRQARSAVCRLRDAHRRDEAADVSSYQEQPRANAANVCSCATESPSCSSLSSPWRCAALRRARPGGTAMTARLREGRRALRWLPLRYASVAGAFIVRHGGRVRPVSRGAVHRACLRFWMWRRRRLPRGCALLARAMPTSLPVQTMRCRPHVR